MLSRPSPECWVVQVWAQADVELVQPQADVELSEPGPMLSRAGLSQCQVEQAQIDIQTTGPWLMSSRAGPGPCQVERSNPGTMSSREGPC